MQLQNTFNNINILANEKVLARLKLPDLTAISANSMRNSLPLPPPPQKKKKLTRIHRDSSGIP
jgi:hypothetical protein